MKEINVKNREFCEEYVKNGYNWTKAYSFVYDMKDLNHAAVWASQLLKKDHVRNYIDVVEWSFKLIWQTQWVDKTTLIKVLKEMLWATKKDYKSWDTLPDWSARNNAILTLSKLTGYLMEWGKEQKPNLDEEDDNKDNIKVSDLTDEDREILREKLLKEI